MYFEKIYSQFLFKGTEYLFSLWTLKIHKNKNECMCRGSPSHSLSADISCAFVCLSVPLFFSFCGAMASRGTPSSYCD